MPVSAPAANPETDVEVEWQLDAIDLRPVERWLAARTTVSGLEPVPGLRIVPEPARRLVDVYVDTADWRLGAAGYVLRVRRRSGRAETTLKSLSSATGALRRRLEVTQPLGANGLEGMDRTGPVGWRVRALAGARPLGSVLEVRTRRRPHALELCGERVGELVLDETAIALGHERRRLRLTRVEVEVVPAFVEAMRPLVERLRRDCGLRAATLSKFEAGLLAAGLSIPGLPDLGPTEVATTATLGELAYRVLRKDALTMLAQAAGTRLGEDIEALHQMRVATRRMRAGLEMFAGVLPVRASRLHAELGWLATVLGEVRDLDIQIERFESWGEEMAEDHRETLDELGGLLRAERVAARAALLEALDSRRYERLVSGLTSMLAQGPSSRFGAGRAPALVAMPPLIEQRHAAACKAARRARHSGAAADYHRLRIRCKRLRYALEFAGGLYGGELKGFVRQMTRLQDTLGAMQDAEVASSRLQGVALSQQGALLGRSTVFAMGDVAGRYRSEAQRLLAELPALVSLLGGKQWRRTTALMDQRLKQTAVPTRPLTAGSLAGRQIGVGAQPRAVANLQGAPVAGDLSCGRGLVPWRRTTSFRPRPGPPRSRIQCSRPMARRRRYRHRRGTRSRRCVARLLRAELLRIGAEGYPDRLASIDSAPKVLWLLGSPPPERAVAIVGTRRPTAFGLWWAGLVAEAAVRAGFGVVSGLAPGVDTVAHRAALAAGGRTWAVLGSGVDVPTPPANAGLAREIATSGGGLLAEVPPGTPGSTRRRVARDRIQSGLSCAVVVCQCETSSGTMHTARFAVLQGRVLAVAAR